MTTDTAAAAAIGAAARELHLPTVRAEAIRLAEIAVREHQTHLGYLAEVLIPGSIPSSRATSAIVRPESITRCAASTLYSAVCDRRLRADITDILPTGLPPAKSVSTLRGEPQATSDLHLPYLKNRDIVASWLRSYANGDWLIVAGDVAERSSDIGWTLRMLCEPLAMVVWTLGQPPAVDDQGGSGAVPRVEQYWWPVDMCRGFGVVTSDDPYPVLDGPRRDGAVAPRGSSLR